MRALPNPRRCRGSVMNTISLLATRCRALRTCAPTRSRWANTCDNGPRILPVWRDHSLIASEIGRGCSVNAPFGEAAISLPRVVFLGLDESECAWFVCDLSHIEEDQHHNGRVRGVRGTWGVWSP